MKARRDRQTSWRPTDLANLRSRERDKIPKPRKLRVGLSRIGRWDFTAPSLLNSLKNGGRRFEPLTADAMNPQPLVKATLYFPITWNSRKDNQELGASVLKRGQTTRHIDRRADLDRAACASLDEVNDAHAALTSGSSVRALRGFTVSASSSSVAHSLSAKSFQCSAGMLSL